MRVAGGCHCGSVRFEADADPEDTSVCHCTDCQSLTGTAFRVSVRARGLRVTAGTPAVYVKVADNGVRREQHFCRDCGSPLFTRAEGEREGWHLRWGAVRQRDALVPREAIWLRSAVPWLPSVPDLPGRDGD